LNLTAKASNLKYFLGCPRMRSHRIIQIVVSQINSYFLYRSCAKKGVVMGKLTSKRFMQRKDS
jgi:hypothetical protein